MKSPSESTVYALALLQNAGYEGDETQVIDKISNFVEGIRFESSKKRRDSTPHGTPKSNRTFGAARGSEREVPGTSGGSSGGSMREATGTLLLQAEKYKANLVAPKGMVPIDDNIRLLRNFDSDDDFFHVSCHIEESLRVKIQAGEFIDLEKLLPKDCSFGGHAPSDENNFMELVSKGGHTYFAPARERGNRINNVKKWDQAFRVYATIYAEAHPEHSVKIWQYIYVIHRAAATYQWENVAFYDYTFRQLMATKPWRSWAKTYTQAWNLGN